MSDKDNASSEIKVINDKVIYSENTPVKRITSTDEISNTVLEEKVVNDSNAVRKTLVEHIIETTILTEEERLEQSFEKQDSMNNETDEISKESRDFIVNNEQPLNNRISISENPDSSDSRIKDKNLFETDNTVQILDKEIKCNRIVNSDIKLNHANEQGTQGIDTKEEKPNGEKDIGVRSLYTKSHRSANPVDIKANPVDIKANSVDIKKANPGDIKANPVDIKANPVDIKANPVDIKANPVDTKTNPVDIKTRNKLSKDLSIEQKRTETLQTSNCETPINGKEDLNSGNLVKSDNTKTVSNPSKSCTKTNSKEGKSLEKPESNVNSNTASKSECKVGITENLDIKETINDGLSELSGIEPKGSSSFIGDISIDSEKETFVNSSTAVVVNDSTSLPNSKIDISSEKSEIKLCKDNAHTDKFLGEDEFSTLDRKKDKKAETLAKDSSKKQSTNNGSKINKVDKDTNRKYYKKDSRINTPSKEDTKSDLTSTHSNTYNTSDLDSKQTKTSNNNSVQGKADLDINFPKSKTDLDINSTKSDSQKACAITSNTDKKAIYKTDSTGSDKSAKRKIVKNTSTDSSTEQEVNTTNKSSAKDNTSPKKKSNADISNKKSKTKVLVHKSPILSRESSETEPQICCEDPNIQNSKPQICNNPNIQNSKESGKKQTYKPHKSSRHSSKEEEVPSYETFSETLNRTAATLDRTKSPTDKSSRHINKSENTSHASSDQRDKEKPINRHTPIDTEIVADINDLKEKNKPHTGKDKTNLKNISSKSDNTTKQSLKLKAVRKDTHENISSDKFPKIEMSSNSRPQTPNQSTNMMNSRSQTPNKDSSDHANSRPHTPYDSQHKSTNESDVYVNSRPPTPSEALRNSRPHITSKDLRNSNSRPQTPSEALKSANSRPQTPSKALKNANSRPQTPSEALRNANSRPQTSSETLRDANSRPQTPSEASRNVNSRPQTPSDTLRDANSRPQTPSEDLRKANSRPKTPSETLRNANSRPQTPSETLGNANSRPQTPSETLRNANSRPQTPSEASRNANSRPQTPSEALRNTNSRPQTPSETLRNVNSTPETPSKALSTTRSRPQTRNEDVRNATSRPQTPSEALRNANSRPETPNEDRMHVNKQQIPREALENPNSRPQTPNVSNSRPQSSNLKSSRESLYQSNCTAIEHKSTAILSSANRAQTPVHTKMDRSDSKRGVLTRSHSIRSQTDSRHSSTQNLNKMISNDDARHETSPVRSQDVTSKGLVQSNVRIDNLTDEMKSEDMARNTLPNTQENGKNNEENAPLRSMPPPKQPMMDISPSSSNGPASMYKSIQHINKAGLENELHVLPIRPPRRSRTSLGFTEEKDNEYMQELKLKEPSEIIDMENKGINNNINISKGKGRLERGVSEYVPNEREMSDELKPKFTSEGQLYCEQQESDSQQQQESLGNSTDRGYATIPKTIQRHALPTSNHSILRAKSERYLPSNPMKDEHRLTALSMNELSRRSVSMVSGMTERSETMSELTQLSTCSSEQTVFSAASRGTVLQKQTAEESTERWIKDIIASQGDFHLKGLLTCYICKHLFKNPVTLTECLHSFCQGCLEATEKQKVENSIGYICSLCGVFTSHDATTKNIFFDELLDIMKISADGVSSTCRQCPDGIEPSWKCIDCKLDLCEKCHTIHLMIPLLSGHKVINLTDASDMVVDRLVFCTRHLDEPIKFNCRECEMVLCIKCKVTEHDTHRIETVDISLKRLLPELHMVTESLEQNLQNLRDKINEVDYKIEVTQNMYDKCNRDIETKAEEEIERIRATQRQLKYDLKQRKDIEMDGLFQFMQKLQYKQNEGNNLRDLVTICIMRGRQMSLLAEVQGGVYPKVRHYKIEIQKESSIQTAHPELSKNTKVNAIFEEGFLGKINYHTIKVLSSGAIPSYKRFMSIKFEEYFTSPLQQILTINLPDQCLSITLVNDRIWAALPYINALQIYDCYGDFIRTQLYEEFQPRVVHQTCDGEVIMGCQFTGLYILDNETADVQFKLASGKYSDICIRDDKIYALDYNLKRVLIFDKSSMSMSNCCGAKWSPTSKTIDVSAAQQVDSVSTLEVHEQYDDHVYICSYNAHTIFHFNQNGELIGKYGHKGMQAAGELYYPMLCSIDKFGFLLLADGENKRLQILDIWGMWRALQIEGLRKPYNVTMDNKQDLWVTQFNDQYQSWQLLKYSDDY